METINYLKRIEDKLQGMHPKIGIKSIEFLSHDIGCPTLIIAEPR